MASSSSLTPCPLGEKCNRKSINHFKIFDHPKPMPSTSADTTSLKANNETSCEVIEIIDESFEEEREIREPGSDGVSLKPMLEKIKENEPYNIFFNKIPASPETHNQINVATFADLLCPSLGDLVCSLQMSFLIDIKWILEQYTIQGVRNKPLTILCDKISSQRNNLNMSVPNLTLQVVEMKDPMGIQHAKIGIYCYSDGSIRVAVFTANLYYQDWNFYNNGFWVSPVCAPLKTPYLETDGNGPTGFKADLLNYLRTFNLECLEQWIDLVRKADFSEVTVFLITSTPGMHYKKSTSSHFYRTGELLSEHCVLPVDNIEGPLRWDIIAQASSIGVYGKRFSDWFRQILLRSLASHTEHPDPTNSTAKLKIIYPSEKNVDDCYYDADCLSYFRDVHYRQEWLCDYLYHWKADGTRRTRAMPHIKTYCRVSPSGEKLAWFLLTSANISRSAWGGFIQKDNGNYNRSYEAGVLFLPKFFNQNYFVIKSSAGNNDKLFPFLYDLPLIAFDPDDRPYLSM